MRIVREQGKSPDADRRVLRNVLANLVGGLLGGGAVALATPVLVRQLGLEQFALVGAWQMLQLMLGLLDLGFGATLTRALADPTLDARDRRSLLKTVELLYFAIGVFAAGGLLLAALALAGHWDGTIARSETTASLRWMAVGLAAQAPAALYLAGLVGVQRQGRASALMAGTNVVRYGGGILLLHLHPSLPLFFAVQAAISAAQCLVLRLSLVHAVGGAFRGIPLRIDLLRARWRYAAGMAATTLLATLMANMDRLVLGTILPVADLGRFTVAFNAANVLQLGIQPIYRAFFPRFTEVQERGDAGLAWTLYLRGSRLVAAGAVPAMVFGVIFADPLMALWTGDIDPMTTRVFQGLLIGIGLAGLGWIPAAYQQATGWTRLHAGMLLAALLLGTPLLWWSIRVFGAPGSVAMWMLHGVLEVTIGLVLMERRLFTGMLPQWYRLVLGYPVVASLAAAWFLRLAMPSASRPAVPAEPAHIAAMVLAGAVVMALLARAAVTSDIARRPS
jgi:O-antigen/teichoic acid export membrane protein